MNTAIIVFVVVGLVLLVIIAFVMQQWRKGKKEKLQEQAQSKKEASTPVSAAPTIVIDRGVSEYNAAATGVGENTSLSSAPGANNRYTLSINADAADPWAALGGIDALTGTNTQENTDEQAAAQRRRRRRSRHVSFLPPTDDDDIPPVPEMPSSPSRSSRPRVSSNLRPSASTPSMERIQMPTPAHHRPPQQPRGILRPSNSSTNIQQQQQQQQQASNRSSVFPIFPQSAEDPLAAMRRPDSYMPSEDVSVNRRDSTRYSQPPPSYEAVMSSSRYR
ncbi:hypothetical protein LPJ74_004036 [Coemansia sp. RSA 1843]|nr:hypothetical protein LPJ74_004036 [Coemansia sp. RSA 1843]